MEIMYANILMLLAQCVFVALLIVTLFRLRLVFGLGVLWIMLGAFQFLQVFFSNVLFLEVASGVSVSSGSMVLFTGSLFAIFLIYISEGILEARKILYAILGTNFVLALLLLIGWWTIIGIEANNIYNLKSTYFTQNILFLFIGTLILVLDVFIAITLYQSLIKFTKSLFFRVLFTMCIVISIDTILITISFYSQSEDYQNILFSGMIFKNLAAILYTAFFTIYLKYFEPNFNKEKTSSLSYLDIFRSLTFYKRYEGAILELQSQKQLTSNLESVLDDISDGFVILDANWCYTYVNKKAGEIIERDPKALIGKNIWNEFPEIVNQPFYKLYLKAFKTQQTQYLQAYNSSIDKWYENKIYPSEEGVTVYFTDITEEKKANLALKESENHIRTILEAEPECIKQLDANGNLIYMNPAGLAMLEVDSLENVKGKSIFNFIKPDHLSAFKKQIQEVFNGQTAQLVFEIIGQNGTKRWLETHAVPLKDIKDNIISLLAVTRDITDRKKVEDQLVENEKLFRHLASNAPVGIFQADKEGVCNYVNEEWMEYSGMSFDQAMDFGWTNATHPEDKERVIKEWHHFVKTDADFVTEFRVLNKNKQVIWLSVKAVKLLDAQNNLYGYIGIALDVTDKKIADKRIIESENYLNKIINNIGDPVFVKDEKSQFITVNDAFCEMFNLPREAILGNTLAEDVSPDEQKVFLKIDKQVLSSGVENINEETLTIRENETRIISTKKTRYVDQNGAKFLIGVVRDITESKKAEIELENHKNNLEELIKLRTEEINSKNDELQRMNRLFVGRELRMIELKKLIEELKSKKQKLN